ncbi:Negative regulator of sexual conjugation and meiosis, partial [Termitomyces sp. T112]
SPSSARTLLQRGIRLNAESIELWREYVKMELGFVESLRRRWEILGIGTTAQEKEDDSAADPSNLIMPGVDQEVVSAEDSTEEETGAEARKEILQGAIVKSVMNSAAEALPKVELFDSLKRLLTEYPLPSSLQETLLEHLYNLLKERLPGDAGAIKLRANRFLTPELKGEALVEGLRRANEELVEAAGGDAREEVCEVYATFVEEWCKTAIDGNMKQYLISTLRSLCRHRESPSLLAAHIRVKGTDVGGCLAGTAGGREAIWGQGGGGVDGGPEGGARDGGGDGSGADVEERLMIRGSVARCDSSWTTWLQINVTVTLLPPLDVDVAACVAVSAQPSESRAMLQYPVQLPPLSLSHRFPKDPHAPSFSPSPPISLPRSPRPPVAASRHPSAASSAIEDVLFPGDFVGEAGFLQGETIVLTHSASRVPEYQQPAREFQVKRRLGHGSYAVVYLVQEVLYRPQPSEDGHASILGMMELDSSKPTEAVYGREYAIKCLSKANLDDEDLAAQMSEVTIHQSLRPHPNIVTLHRTLETSSFLLLLLEYVPGEDLFYFLEQARDHFHSESPNTPDCSISHTPPTPSLLSTLHPAQLLSRTRLRLISSMFSQMCEAVAECHDQSVFHRDIKPENFIVTDGWTTLSNGRQERKVIVKLSDFGLSTTDVASSDMDCGSAPYMSYECRNNVAPTYRPRAADVWSLGIVLINMLYHSNPWTDTAQGACSSFDLYRRDPINFFMYRFAGMTRPVAEHLANKVFCILEDPEDDSPRIGAREFGNWVRQLPSLLGSHTMHRTVSSSSQGYPIASSTPLSHRPSSRHPSGTSTVRSPAIQPRILSRAPSLSPAYEAREHPDLSTHSDLSTVFDHEPEPEENENDRRQGQVLEGMESRSTSTHKRRKRGARKGKGATTQDAKYETLATLADASQSLAREISKASRSSSTNLSVSSRNTGTTSSSRRAREPFEPVSLYAMPTALLNVPRSISTSSRGVSPPAPPVPSVSPLPVTKKPSKWKLSFGKNSASALVVAGRVSPVEEISSSSSVDTHGSYPMSTTATNVTNLIMGLDAPPPPLNADEKFSTWGRGRRDRLCGPPPSNASNKSLVLSQGSEPYWERRNDRGTSPNSTRSGRPLVSSASSVVSTNWRSSIGTTSSAGTSTSAFTRYSNSSCRSISTTATSVSSTSWRTNLKPKSSTTVKNNNNTGYPALPKNIKIIDSAPWELDELPRVQHPKPIGDIFGSPPVRKQRTKKNKDVKLDTITERPQNAVAG